MENNWMSSDDKTNVLLKKLTDCVAERTFACEERLTSIESVVKVMLLKNVEQMEDKSELWMAVKTLSEQMIVVSQQLLEITNLLLAISKKSP